MSKTNPPYPAAFRAEAVALVHARANSIPVVARVLGRRRANTVLPPARAIRKKAAVFVAQEPS